MSTRYLIAALLMTSACAAHADVTPATSTSSGFLSSWTTGNGTDVISSGVLSDNASLIGGVAHGSDASLTQALYQKASANAAKTDGVVKISMTQGIDGDYLTKTSNAVLLAVLGDGLQAVVSPDGLIISHGQQASATAPASGGSGSSTPSKTTTNSTTSSNSTTNTSTTNSTSNSNNTTNTSTTNTNTTSTTNTIKTTEDVLLTENGALQAAPAADQELGNGPLAQQDSANVPEPSSIALLAAGLFGAAGLRRRAKR